jgi:Uri superfamily endonuclease
MRGTYTIIVESKSDGYRVFGRLGRAKLRRGKYLYTGSAMGSGATSLERRLQRHGASSKTLRWHIDYLTSRPRCTVSGAVYVVSNKRLECSANLCISEELKLHPVLPKIGASDCNCDGHLLGPELHLSKMTLLKRLVNVYCRLARSDPSSRQVVQIDCASSHLFWNASRKILIRPWFFV